MDGVLNGRTAARPLGLARIGIALAILLELRGSADALFRLADPRFIRTPYVDWAPSVTEPLAWVLTLLWAVAGVSFLVGWWTRPAGSVLTATLASVLFLDQQLYSNHLYLMTLAAALLTVADSGAALSLDAMRHGTRASVPAWAPWLLKVQVSIVYAFAALSKVNLTFLSGSVVASYLRRDGLLAVPAEWRAVEPMMVLAILAICLEAFLAIGLWLPRWRPAAFVAGLALHIGITGWLSPTFAIGIFSLLMLSLFLLFLEVEPKRVVVWDDSCGFCAGWVRWFRRLDWLHALEFVPASSLPRDDLPVSADEAAVALQLVTPRRVRAGFGAVTGVAELLPVSFLWAPLLRLAPIRWLGERTYARVAARRLCALPAAS
ncbi:MAG TPA: HTTM domain-containing protein [candidate division Zixibacteria bacterium]|nr:HTTM domain-containing protein [candidate division Zixibacteria bacterium]